MALPAPLGVGEVDDGQAIEHASRAERRRGLRELKIRREVRLLLAHRERLLEQTLAERRLVVQLTQERLCLTPHLERLIDETERLHRPPLPHQRASEPVVGLEVAERPGSLAEAVGGLRVVADARVRVAKRHRDGADHVGVLCL